MQALLYSFSVSNLMALVFSQKHGANGPFRTYNSTPTMSNSSHWLPVSPGKKMGLSSEPSISFLVVPARDSEGTCTQGTTARPQTSTEHTRTETVDSSLPAVVQVPPESVLIKTAGGTRLLSDYDPGTIAARGPVDLWMKPAFDLFKKLFGERHMLMCTYAVVGPEDEFESEVILLSRSPRLGRGLRAIILLSH